MFKSPGKFLNRAVIKKKKKKEYDLPSFFSAIWSPILPADNATEIEDNTFSLRSSRVLL